MTAPDPQPDPQADREPGPGSGRIRAPLPLVAAAILVGVEAVCLVLLGVAELMSIEVRKLAMGVTTSLFFLVYGAGLGLFGSLLYRLRSWTRAPVVLAQLIQLGVAWSFRSGGTAPISVLLAAVAVLVLAGVFHPASTQALAEREEQDLAGKDDVS